MINRLFQTFVKLCENLSQTYHRFNNTLKREDDTWTKHRSADERRCRHNNRDRERPHRGRQRRQISRSIELCFPSTIHWRSLLSISDARVNARVTCALPRTMYDSFHGSLANRARARASVRLRFAEHVGKENTKKKHTTLLENFPNLYSRQPRVTHRLRSICTRYWLGRGFGRVTWLARWMCQYVHLYSLSTHFLSLL